MKIAVLLACLVLGTIAVPDKTWNDYKAQNGKKYSSSAEETKARANYDANDKIIQANNAAFAAGKSGFMMGHNDLSDMNQADYKKTRCGAKVNAVKLLRQSATAEELRVSSLPDVRQSTSANGKASFGLAHNNLSDLSLADYKKTRCGTKVNATKLLRESPIGEELRLDSLVDVRQTSSVDYSTATCMTPVKNQGQCGSCYAFSATAALEYYNCKKFGTKKIFSEQQFVDCSSAYGNYGCNGGFYSNCYEYMITKSFGVALSSSYPYVAKNQTCKYASTMKAGSVASYKWSLPQGNETVMMSTFLAAQGPVNVAIDAGQSSFQLYKSGVYNDNSCTTSVNHAVLVVGYGTVNGTNYWKIKNSWGTNWGSAGYMLMQRGVNRCGIAGYVLYPVV